MAVIVLHRHAAGAPVLPALEDLPAEHRLCGPDAAEAADAQLHIHQLGHWPPAWVPATPGPNLVLSPRPPDEPMAAWLGGVDAWLPSDSSAAELGRWIAAILERGPAPAQEREPE
ncbi:MAG: hypothetical protein ACOCXJ_07520 [Planctomycetota bacterium]